MEADKTSKNDMKGIFEVEMLTSYQSQALGIDPVAYYTLHHLYRHIHVFYYHYSYYK